MSQRNKNNSIIFLTTLSVYLGLVLVGGAMPYTLAQTASERKVESKYLTDEKVLAEYVLTFQSLFLLSKDFSVNYPKEWTDGSSKHIKFGEYELNCFFNLNPDSTQSINGTGVALVYSDVFDLPLRKLNGNFPHTTEKGKQQLKINVTLSDKDFSLKVNAYQDSDEQAQQIFNSYIYELSKIKTQQSDQSGIIYQNTEITRENNQIIIVTRLPRGSLDELLKQNAKAEK